MYAVLDIVGIVDEPGRGAIVEIRRYADGSSRYGVGEVGGLYGEQQLRPTGDRMPLAFYALPSPFRHRDVVRIGDDAGLAGRTGVIEGEGVIEAEGECDGEGEGEGEREGEVEDGPTLLAVWVEDLQELRLLEPQQLVRTGERRPAPADDEQRTSSRIGPDGTHLGEESYIVVDRLERYW